MRKIIVLLVSLLLVSSAAAWNANPTYNPFETLWNAFNTLLTDVLDRLDDLEAGQAEMNEKLDRILDILEVTACEDGLDNDADGWIDSADPDCTTGEEETGFGSTACNDGIDNDGDGDVDNEDADCVDAFDDDESSPAPPECTDGLDNDADGWIDLDDPDCPINPEFGFSSYACNDGIDNDGDGDVDADDSDCYNGFDDNEDTLGESDCSDGLDNDGDGFKDNGAYCNTGKTCCSWSIQAQYDACLANYEASILSNPPDGDLTLLPCVTPLQSSNPDYGLCYNPGEICDEIDNNCDGAVDEYMLKCGTPLHCPTIEVCNGEDDDCDGTIDNGADASCDDGLYCTGAEICSSGICTGVGDPCPGPDGDSDCSESCNEMNDDCSANDPDGSLCSGGSLNICKDGFCE